LFWKGGEIPGHPAFSILQASKKKSLNLQIGLRIAPSFFIPKVARDFPLAFTANRLSRKLLIYPGRSSGLWITLLAAPSHLASTKQWPYAAFVLTHSGGTATVSDRLPFSALTGTRVLKD
jgi:hypothetical protein